MNLSDVAIADYMNNFVNKEFYIEMPSPGSTYGVGSIGIEFVKDSAPVSTVAGVEKHIGSFTPKLNGTMYASVDVYTGGAGWSVKVYKNDVFLKEIDVPSGPSFLHGLFDVVAGAKYSITVTSVVNDTIGTSLVTTGIINKPNRPCTYLIKGE